MSKITLTSFALLLLLFFGNSSRNYAAQSKQNTSDAPTGTLQKMIVENGSVTMDLDLNRLNVHTDPHRNRDGDGNVYTHSHTHIYSHRRPRPQQQLLLLRQRRPQPQLQHRLRRLQHQVRRRQLRHDLLLLRDLTRHQGFVLLLRRGPEFSNR